MVKLLFLVSISVTFHLTFVQIIISSVKVAEWSPFGKDLFTRLTICSLGIIRRSSVVIVKTVFKNRLSCLYDGILTYMICFH